MNKKFLKKMIRQEKAVNSNKIRIVQEQIQIVRKYIDKLIKDKKISLRSEAREYIVEEIKRDIDEYIKVRGRIPGKQLQNSAAKYLLEDNSRIKAIYEMLSKSPIEVEESPYYDANIERSAVTLMKQMMKIIEDSCKKVGKKPNCNMVYECIKRYMSVSNEELHCDYVKFLEYMINIFDKYGFIDEDIERYNRIMEELKLADLQIVGNREEKIKEVFDKDSLISRYTKELVVMNLFWQNRLVKYMTDIYYGIFYMDQMDIWNQINKDEKKLSKDKIRKAFVKKDFLDELNSHNALDKKGEYKSRIYEYKASYHDYFSRIFPNQENDLKVDADENLILYNQCERIYQSKLDFAYKAFELLRGEEQINWGYIPSDDKRTIIIGIDYPKYNLPVTVHMLKEGFAVSMMELKMNEIPVYIGNEDYIIGNRRMPTNVLYRMSNKKKKYITGKAKEMKIGKEVEKYPLIIKHMNTQAQGIMPHGKNGKREYIKMSQFLEPKSQEER